MIKVTHHLKGTIIDEILWRLANGFFTLLLLSFMNHYNSLDTTNTWLTVTFPLFQFLSITGTLHPGLDIFTLLRVAKRYFRVAFSHTKKPTVFNFFSLRQWSSMIQIYIKSFNIQIFCYMYLLFLFYFKAIINSS